MAVIVIHELKGGYNLRENFTAGTPPGSNYSSSDNLVGWWRLNESVPSGGSFLDSSIRRQDGTTLPGRTPVFTDDTPSNRIQAGSCTFDNTNDKISIGSASTWNSILGTLGSKKMTFSAWYNISGVSGNRYIFDFSMGNVDAYLDAGDDLWFKSEWTGTNGKWYTTGLLSYTHGTWVHIAISYDPSSTSNAPVFYVNGEKAGSVTSATPTGTWATWAGSACTLGARTTGASPFDGTLADMAVWDSILGAGEIKAIYNASKGAIYRGWRNFDVKGSTASNSGSIEPFLQGINIQTQRQSYLGMFPKMFAASRPNLMVNGKPFAGKGKYFDDTLAFPKLTNQRLGTGLELMNNSSKLRVGSSSPISETPFAKLSFAPNHERDNSDFGVPKLFKDDEPYEDMVKFNPLTYLADDEGTLVYPYIGFNVSMREPDQMDGVIEPLAIRSRASRNSVDWPFEAHSIWGFLCDGAEDSRRHSCPIKQEISLQNTSHFEPFLDGGAEFMGSKLKDAIVIHGFLDENPATIFPFDESSDWEVAAKGLIKEHGSSVNKDIDRVIFDIVTSYTGSVEMMGYREVRSAAAGFIYGGNATTPNGTDSLAFGGLKK